MSAGQESLTSIVALVGAPNSGKTTLYNWLTNSKFKTVNYPGATVEYSIGQSAERYGGPSLSIMDTPGTYSLFPKSADEEVTLRALYHHPQFGHSGKVIVVIDGAQMARHLLLAKQLQQAGFSIVIAITMSDLLAKAGVELDIELLKTEFKAPVVRINGLLGGGILELLQQVVKLPLSGQPTELVYADGNQLANQVKSLDALAHKVVSGSKANALEMLYENTAKLDRYLLHPVGGLVLFFLIMTSLFAAIFWLAQPFMDGIDSSFSFLNRLILSWGADGALWADFAANGLVSSFSSVLVFVPQIFILFVGIGMLESSGYLARAATLIDRPFSKVGLSGRSFVPLLSGFACAVPAMMATRNLGSARDRWITNFIIPLMTCSARLPVYALLLTFLFRDEPAWKAGFVLALIYFLSVILGAITAAILNKILAKNQKSFFMMGLPLYRSPQWKIMLQQAFSRTMGYVRRAGPTIFVFAVLIWVGTTFPNYKAEQVVKLESSYLGQVGQILEPGFRPLGVDWRVGVGLLSAFAAREVFVSSLAVIFNVTGEDEALREGMLTTMKDAKLEDGTPLFTLASVLGLIVFFMIALQCMSTFAIAVRESGSMKFAVAQLVVYNVLAYVVAVGVVQGLRAAGIS